VVEVPSPYTGTIMRLHAQPGDTVQTGKPLVDFDLPDSVSGQNPEPSAQPSADQGMVVGHMSAAGGELIDRAVIGRGRRVSSERVRAAPAVRMLAKRLGIDLASCRPTGRHGLVSVDDVLARANLGSGSGSAPVVAGLTDADRLRGTRKAMSASMSVSRDQIAMCTVFDDADIQLWHGRDDITVRVIRAIVAGVKAEPGLNALFDASVPARKIVPEVHLAVAVDTAEGLIVPVIRDVGSLSATEVRARLNDIKERTRNRSIGLEQLRDYTFTLSYFGLMAGGYATPLVTPPTVAILGCGRLQRDVVAGDSGPEIHMRLPLSLTFDHRCITGGEACRFLAAVIADLAKPS
jgi:pyruvate dehydrogenase E2 component (dihydrolipoamide acetyltransferase)